MLYAYQLVDALHDEKRSTEFNRAQLKRGREITKEIPYEVMKLLFITRNSELTWRVVMTAT